MDPFLGEIRLFTWNWPPQGWALCNGASLNIQQNLALNSLLGNTFGGDQKTFFNLPDLRGRVPVNIATNQGTQPDGTSAYVTGNSGGAETVTLIGTQVPAHTHDTNVSTNASNYPIGTGGLLGPVAQFQTHATINIYTATASSPLVVLAAATVESAGGGAGHNNMQPWAVGNYCIAMTGLYPPRQ